MLTKNEYIASIMLEAADLLKNDTYYDIESIREDYNEYQSLINLINESIALCESLNRVIDKYESNIYYSLNESVGSAIWEGIKKLCEKIRKWWDKFIKWIHSGKKAAKEDGEIVDPSKAEKLVNKIAKAYDSGNDMSNIDIENIKKKIKKNDPPPNYDSVRNKIDQLINRINKEKDESMSKHCMETLNILNKLNDKIAQSIKIFSSNLLPEGKVYSAKDKLEDDRNAYDYKKGHRIYDKKGRVISLSTETDKGNKQDIRYTYDKKGNVIKKSRITYRDDDDEYTEDTLHYRPGSKDPYKIYSVTDDIENDGTDKTKINYFNNDKNTSVYYTRKGYDNESRQRVTPNSQIDYKYKNGSTYDIKDMRASKTKPLYVNKKGQASDTLPDEKKTANEKKQETKEVSKAKGKNINETIEFLYDEAILAETVEEFNTIMEAIEALED